MGLYSSLGVGVTGVQSQGNRIDTISNNIANINTVGYKAGIYSFSDLIASDRTASYSPGGVAGTTRQKNGAQGEITGTQSTTDIAIDGAGFIPVSELSPAEGIVFTRAGSFRQDLNGDFRNDAGFFLQGWRLDDNEDVPVAVDVANLTADVAIANLTTVNVSQITQDPVATTAVSILANLLSSQAIYAGPPAYDPTLNTANMASGSVPESYNLPVTVIDDLGEEHTIQINFLKTAINSWSVELVAVPATDVTAPDGQLAYGTLDFNGDGTLSAVSATLAAPIAASWTTAATASSITFDWGTAGAIGIGLGDGLTQLDDTFHIINVLQNGTVGGDPTTVAIDAEGYVSASYTDGTVHRLFKIPLVNFIEPDKLQSLTGNVFAQSEVSGVANFRQIGDTGVGQITPGALEASTTDLGLQLADMIVAQRAYQANTKTITTSDDMLKKLDELLR